MYNKMFKTIFLFLSFFSFSSYSFLTNMPELRRQYQDYLRIFDKTETSYGFETFVENLNTVEYYNKNNNDGCKMYLTQYSDTFDPEAVLFRCH